jgi:hypothetical protein
MYMNRKIKIYTNKVKKILSLSIQLCQILGSTNVHHMLILNAFETLGRDRPNTNSSRSKTIDRFTYGRR